MAHALNVTPTADAVSTGVKDTEAVAEALADVLADTYRLVFKTHAYHWNVEGPLFHAVHTLTEEQYTNMFEGADELAERIRSLGHLAPARMAEIVDRSRIADTEGALTAQEMVTDLAADHERIAKRMHALAEIAGGQRDIVSEDLATARSSFHEQAAWMLRALAK